MTEIFQDFGFPVAMVIILLLAICYLHKDHKAEIAAMRQEFKEDMQREREENRAAILEITETHSKEMKEITKSVNRLSDSIENLSDRVHSGGTSV